MAQFHFKGLVAGLRGGGDEEFKVDVGIRPMAGLGAGDDGVDQALGAAHVQVLAGVGGGQQRLQVEAAGRVVIRVHGQAAARQRFELGQEGQLIFAAATVVQMKVAASRFERGGHGGNRRDADAARDQHHGLVACRGFMQREIVLGAFDAKRVAVGQRVHVARSALAGFLQPHTQPVFRGLRELAGVGRQLHQRIAARFAQAWHRHFQVRAGAEGG
ncbi:hypothetical protein D3C71_1252370 [compost metagenome]